MPAPIPHDPAQPEDGHLLVFENAIEQHEPVALDVQGQIPPWLTGSLYRTGPGTFRIKSPKAPGGRIDIRHWFDGLGMNHRFELLPGGRVEYRNHSTASGRAQRIADDGAAHGVFFGTQDPCETLFSKFFTFFTAATPDGEDVDNYNVSVTLSPNMPGVSSHTAAKNTPTVPKTLIAKTDTSRLQIVDPETLDPLRLLTYKSIDARLDGQVSAAHSCQDPETKEYFNYSLVMGRTPTYKVFRITPGAAGEKEYAVDIIATITDAPSAYLHSFSLTKKYVILCVWQADHALSGLSVMFNRSITSSLKPWNPARNALFYVIDRAGGLVGRFTAPSFFAFHQINAHDAGADDVVIDLAAYEDYGILELLHLDHMRTIGPESKGTTRGVRPRRFVLRDVRAGGADTPRQAEVAFALDERYNIELPTIHPGRYHQTYRYTYGIHKAHPSAPSFADTVIKIDMENPDSEPKRWGGAQYVPGEPIFVPRPGSTEEDDGVIVSVVLDADARRSMLVVLDAKDLSEVARAEMRTHVPLGFHGAWFGASL